MTDEAIRALRFAASIDGDDGLAYACDRALRGPYDHVWQHCRERVAAAVAELRSTNPDCAWVAKGCEPCKRVTGQRCVPCQEFFRRSP